MFTLLTIFLPIYNLIKKEIYEGKEIKTVEFENKEQESYFRQKHRSRLINKQVFRDYMDENDSVIIQYVVLKHLREILIEKAHISMFSAHPGKDMVLHRLRSRCYWPKMNIDIEKHLKESYVCQDTKSPSNYNKAELQKSYKKLYNFFLSIMTMIIF